MSLFLLEVSIEDKEVLWKDISIYKQETQVMNNVRSIGLTLENIREKCNTTLLEEISWK